MPHPAIFNPIGQPFIILSSVDSTNNYAMAQAQAGMAHHGTAWFALEQTAGRGQRGKDWLTRPHENILLSIMIKPDCLQAGNQFLLSATVALGCYDFYKNYAGEDTRIKWPNDLYWRDRKAGGILIENSFRGSNWLFAIAGIGININQTKFAPGLSNPVSLKQITGKTFDVQELGRELCRNIEDRYRQLNPENTDIILHDYQQSLYKMKEPARLKRDNVAFNTTIQGVSPAGRLLTANGEFDFGEVEWVFSEH